MFGKRREEEEDYRLFEVRDRDGNRIASPSGRSLHESDSAERCRQQGYRVKQALL